MVSVVSVVSVIRVVRVAASVASVAPCGARSNIQRLHLTAALHYSDYTLLHLVYLVVHELEEEDAHPIRRAEDP